MVVKNMWAVKTSVKGQVGFSVSVFETRKQARQFKKTNKRMFDFVKNPKISVTMHRAILDKKVGLIVSNPVLY